MIPEALSFGLSYRACSGKFDQDHEYQLLARSILQAGISQEIMHKEYGAQRSLTFRKKGPWGAAARLKHSKDIHLSTPENRPAPQNPIATFTSGDLSPVERREPWTLPSDGRPSHQLRMSQDSIVTHQTRREGGKRFLSHASSVEVGRPRLAVYPSDSLTGSHR